MSAYGHVLENVRRGRRSSPKVKRGALKTLLETSEPLVQAGPRPERLGRPVTPALLLETPDGTRLKGFALTPEHGC